MRAEFADTHFWVASLNPKDEWHEQATERERQIGVSVTVVTTEEVLSEVLNWFAGHGPYIRQAAASMVERIREDPNIRVIPQSSETFAKGFARYRQRLDKRYSLVDCISMVTVNELGITVILTNDHHFEQEGLEILLRRDGSR